MRQRRPPQVGTTGTNAHPALVAMRLTSAIGIGKSKNLYSPQLNQPMPVA
jgi:hypothetical protein